ncbi:HD-GYP domain-containing protein [Fundidesulfovibrio terrae]|uniref:HD-GYP domain-containing protein n=1 Tax=Fundidesulfovibrio terrae TaxID=2922866 RepID=UPI001FB03FFE|nr:HD domain-containing phosphohydrolase [Fundidesulfovibrio terrae]
MSEQKYLPISPLLITHGDAFSFNVYLKNKTSQAYVLFAASEKMTDRHKISLVENDVSELYIDLGDSKRFEKYIYENYGKVLSNEGIPLSVRAEIFHDHSTSLSREVFATGLPGNVVPPEMLEKIERTLTSNYEFLVSNSGAFKSVARLIDHNYKTYSHCVNVSVYTLVMLVQLNRFDAIETDAGVGAFLHDIGKQLIPNEILDKPARLTDAEFDTVKKHSQFGFSIAKQSGLPDVACECALKHHEKLDGSGYPLGLAEDDLPYYAQAVTIADIYDALTAERPYCRAYTPFEALKIMAKDVDRGKLDKHIFKLLVDVLGGNLWTT